MSSKTSLIANVTGYTGSSGGLITFGALCFRGDRILGTAKAADDLRDRFEIDHEINGQGHILLPGLIDAHGHILKLGYSLLDVDLSDAESIKEIQNQIIRYARQHPEKEWIRGYGWDQSKWRGGRFPTAKDIDQVVADRPVWLTRKDSHAGWANSEALQRAGIDAEVNDPPGGTIIRNDAGNPVGVFVDQAMERIEEHIPDADMADNKRALDKALARFRSLGLTSVHDACMGPDKYHLLKDYAEGDNLTVRIYAMVDGRSSFYRDWLDHGPEKDIDGDHLTIGGMKFFADGALGSRGAALLKPYSDDPGNRGFLFYRDSELAEKIKESADAGFQVNIHAIGDRANRTVLDAHEIVSPNIHSEMRHRVEHAQILHPDDIPRLRELNLIASIQPAHAIGDMQMAEARLGSERLKTAYAWKRLKDEKISLAAGSDFPIESADPFYGMHTAVNRQNRNRQPPEGWFSAQSLSLRSAFEAYTLGAAYASHQENMLGSLERGKKADFVMVDSDIFKEKGYNLPEVEVLATWVGGEKVYAND